MSKKLYIVHGWTYSIEPWTATVSILRSEGVEVKQLRVPGLTDPSDKVWTIDEYVEWLRGEIADDPNPTVLGHSNGGRISLNLLSATPDRYKKLILLNSAGVYENPGAVSLKRRVFRFASKALSPLRRIPLARKVVYRLLGAGDYNQAPPNMKQTLHNMLESDKNLAIESVTTPATILWGRKDTTTPIGQGRKMAKLLPHAQLHEFDDWAHAPYITHPNELATAILAALEEK